MGGEELRFTGNWFVDAGILGFVNLMEEVYGWNLEELQKCINENPEKVYYGYFPLAYIFRRSVISGIYRQQKDLRDLIGKSLEKKKKTLDTIKKEEDKKKELQSKAKKSSKANRELQKYEEKITSLKKQVDEIDKFMNEVNKYISLVNKELLQLKNEFKRRVEKIVEDYDEFNRQYSDYFKDSDWIYTVIPLDKTAELNKRLEGILLQGVELKLLTVTEKKNEVGNILKRLSSLGNFVIYPNANERNFYLYNPRKEDEYTALLYTIALVREDIEKIKLILGIKYDQKNPKSLRLRLFRFLTLCQLNNVEPTKIIADIESALNEGIPKKKAVNTILKRYKVSTSKEELAEILSEVYKNFKELIDRRGTLITYEVIPDSTINPFLFSPNEFSNLSYTSLPKVSDLKKLLPNAFPPYILFLVFFDAFIPVYGRGIMFYTPELNSCYSINKRIRIKIELSRENNRGGLLKITWSAILDELIETKSKFSLENMYLIEVNIKQNKLDDVEYIGIPKLYASIILDDQIRDALNTTLPVGDSNVWLLGEFIKQRALYPLISKHLWNAVRKNGFPNWRASLYTLAVDAKLRGEGNLALFGKAFFEHPKRAAVEAKDFHREMNSTAMTIRALSSETGGKNLVYSLFSALRRHNRNAFVNAIIKALLQSKSKDKVALITSYLFKHVLNNDSSWEDFALALVIGLAGGGSSEES